MFRKHFRIIKERVTSILPYHIQERYTIFFFIHWWGTPTFAPPHLHLTYKEAYDYIKEQCPNAIIQESLRDKCVRKYGEHFGELYDKSCMGEPIGNITQTKMFLDALEKVKKNMITEDYVSFEVAKLLKEKGFPQEYDIYHSLVYNEEDYENEYEIQRMVLETELVKAGTLSSYPIGVPEPKCYCPTHQMAMKWLREVHNINIDIVSIWNQIRWEYQIFIITPTTSKRPYVDNTLYTGYEEAVESALKYVLENLIW